MVKKKSQNSAMMVSVVALVVAVVGIVFSMAQVGQPTEIAPGAAATYCSPKSPEANCIGKKVGQSIRNGKYTCEETGDEDNLGRPLCDQELANGNSGYKKCDTQYSATLCRGKVDGYSCTPAGSYQPGNSWGTPTGFVSHVCVAINSPNSSGEYNCSCIQK